MKKLARPRTLINEAWYVNYYLLLASTYHYFLGGKPRSSIVG